MKNMSLITIMVCVLGLGNLTGQAVEERTIGKFTEIKASTGIVVYLEKGERESVRVEAERGDADNVVTEVSGRTLKIHYSRNNSRSNGARVYVTYVTVNDISASSAAGIYGRSVIKTDRLAVSASSAANIELSVEVEDLEASASTSADLVLEGTTSFFEGKASTAGDIDAYQLTAEEVNVEATTAGRAKVTVKNKIEARASTAGEVRYRGDPDKSYIDSSTGGTVTGLKR